MSNQELQEMLLIQTNITTIILAVTVTILFGVLIDLVIHLFTKYIKKGDKND